MKIVSLTRYLLARFLGPFAFGIVGVGLLVGMVIVSGTSSLENFFEQSYLRRLTQRVRELERIVRTMDADARHLGERLLSLLSETYRHPDHFPDAKELETFLQEHVTSLSPEGLRVREIHITLETLAPESSSLERQPSCSPETPLPSSQILPMRLGDLRQGPTLPVFWPLPNGTTWRVALVFSRERLMPAFDLLDDFRTLPFVEHAGLYTIENGAPVSPFSIPIPPREVLAARTWFRSSRHAGEPLRLLRDTGVTILMFWKSPRLSDALNSPPILRLALDFSFLERMKRNLLGIGATALVLFAAGGFLLQGIIVCRALMPLKRLTASMAFFIRDQEHRVGEGLTTTSIREFIDLYANFLHLVATVTENIARLREIDSIKTSLLSNVSHEFRTPMTAVRGFARLLLDRMDQKLIPLTAPLSPEKWRQELEEMREELEVILAESEHLSHLVDNMVDLAQLQEDTEHWTMLPLDPREPLEHALESFRPLLSGTPVTLQTDIPAHIPFIRGDLRRLTQVVEHLLSNAFKFTRRGSISCSIRHEGGFVVTRVEDTGGGIDPSHQHHIFDPFSQVGDVLTAKPSGVGLGLSLCKAIVQRHGGWINMTSRQGRGSAFFFGIPTLADPLLPTFEPPECCTNVSKSPEIS